MEKTTVPGSFRKSAPSGTPELYGATMTISGSVHPATFVGGVWGLLAALVAGIALGVAASVGVQAAGDDAPPVAYSEAATVRLNYVLNHHGPFHLPRHTNLTIQR